MYEQYDAGIARQLFTIIYICHNREDECVYHVGMTDILNNKQVNRSLTNYNRKRYTQMYNDLWVRLYCEIQLPL